MSTVLGVAAATDGPTVALTGDLSFLHDVNGLLGVGRRALDAVFVVVDNNGGGIFSFLPYRDTVAPDPFEQVLATPPGTDLAELAAAYHVPIDEIEKASALAPAVHHTLAAGGVRVVRVRTDRSANVDRHRAVWAAVAAALQET